MFQSPAFEKDLRPAKGNLSPLKDSLRTVPSLFVDRHTE